MRPRGRWQLAALAAALATCGVPAGADAAERLPAGSAVAGVQVGGLGPIGAERELRRALGAVWERPITVRVGARDRSLSTARAGLSIDYAGMVKRAFDLAARRRGVDVPLERSISSGKLTAGVRWVARPFYRAPRNARVRFGITKVVRIRHRSGRGLDTGRLRRAVLAELRAPTETRIVKASVGPIRPKVTLRNLSRVYGSYISISRGTTTLRLFKRLRLARTYRIAVGAAGFDTPSGLRRVLSKERNPAWHAPNRPWAGPLAGQTIPPGDPRNPLKAWFISLGGGVGIHGTAEEWSIGTRASHGCIRMRVRDVVRLAPLVPVGTPVLIR
jgi:lipoprotein-anchoring transpeptidase ErfK/SrfK